MKSSLQLIEDNLHIQKIGDEENLDDDKELIEKKVQKKSLEVFEEKRSIKNTSEASDEPLESRKNLQNSIKKDLANSSKKSLEKKNSQKIDKHFDFKEDDDVNYIVLESEDAENFITNSLKEFLEWCELLLKHLNCLALLYVLIQTTSNSADNTLISNLNLENLAQRGYGFYREQVIFTFLLSFTFCKLF